MVFVMVSGGARDGPRTTNHDKQMARIRTVAARIRDGERKLAAIKPVWAVVEPLYAKWLGLLAEYEALVREAGEAA